MRNISCRALLLCSFFSSVALAGSPETQRARASAKPDHTAPVPNAVVGPVTNVSTFSESFNDITTLAGNGWVMSNLSSPVGSTNWFQGTNVAGGGPFDAYNGNSNAYIAANYNNTGSTGTISNWLLTPVLDFGNGATFSFYTRKVDPDTYADRLEVRLSTNGPSANVGASASAVGDFSTLSLSINPNQVLGVYPIAWTKYTISGLPHNGQGRIAFRYFVTGAGFLGTSSDYIGIDQVDYNAGTPEFHLGGSVNGLAGSGLTLQVNGADDLLVSANGSFTFPSYITNGSAYNVTVHIQPSNPNQTCAVDNGSGTISGADVSNVAVTCTTTKYAVGGMVTGLAGTGLSLQLNGGSDLAIAADGSFSFPGIPDGSTYAVTVGTQPTGLNQTCTVAGGSGTLNGADVAVTVTCVTKSYAIGGEVDGLSGTGLVLQLNAGNDLPVAADGAFAFPNPLTDGSTYAVTISVQPSGAQGLCVVLRGAGAVAGSDVADIQIPCDVIYIDGFEGP